jgi:DNA-binding Lrp family transcriptional regulator
MTKNKFTKTATFLFPLLNIPKSLFDCNILDPWGRIKFRSRFLNAYLKDSNITKYNDKGYIFLLVRDYRDVEFDKFYSTIQSFPNYIDDYEVRGCIILVFSVPSDFIPDYNLIIKGLYSEVSAEAKKLILGNSYFSGKIYTLPLIMNKAKVLKDSWEERLSNPGSIADLKDQEVWPIISCEREILDSSIASEYSTNSKHFQPSGEF